MRTFNRETWSDRAMSDLSESQRRWVHILAGLLLVSVLAFVYLAQTGDVVRQIEEMQHLEATLSQVKRENSRLRLRVAEYEQWPRLRHEAGDLGFAEPLHVEYVEVLVSAPPVYPLENEMLGETPLLAPSLDVSSRWQELRRQFAAWIRGEQADAESTGEVR